jgi:hypothetical protein
MNAQARPVPSALLRSTLLLLGAYVFAYSVLVTLHELGHFLALRLYGVTDVRIVLHPFTGSYTSWNTTNAFIGVVDAAGPLNAILIGTIVTAALWSRRRPALLPFLFLGPVAYLTEGLSNFMQVALQSPGSDAMRIVAAGVPEIVLLVLTVALFLLGIVSLMSMLPLVDLAPESRFPERFGVLAIGLGMFMLLGIGYGMLVDNQAVSRNGPHLLFALVMAGLLAALYRPLYPWLARTFRNAVTPVAWSASQAAMSLAAGIVALQLLFFN